MMSPQTTPKQPGRLTLGNVRSSLMTQFAASIVDSGGKGDLPSEDWATLANRQGLRIEMLQKEVAVAISNIKVHKDDVSTDAVLPPAEQECHLRNRLNIHLTEVGKSFSSSSSSGSGSVWETVRVSEGRCVRGFTEASGPTLLG